MLQAIRAICLALSLTVNGAPAPLRAQQTGTGHEVRQIVTFLFQPGRADSAVAVYERHILPAYRENVAMLRFRALREVESPEPLDLIVVSSFDGMAGMDASNDALRRQSASGRTLFQWYGVLSALAQWHHDQFVEMLPQLSDIATAAADSSGGLVVMEYVRVVPGAHQQYERAISTTVRPLEQKRALARWSETGRMLVSDGWDYIRIIGLDSLSEWQAYQSALGVMGAEREVARLVAARKTIIVRPWRALSVR